nr:MAG TPA: adenylate kinase [Caudoviricetes sp.]
MPCPACGEELYTQLLKYSPYLRRGDHLRS